MRKWIMVSCSVLALALLAKPASALPTMEDLTAQIAKAATELKTWSHDMKLTFTVGDKKVVITGKEVGMVSPDGKTACKSRDTGVMTGTDDAGQELRLDRCDVIDGTFCWEEMRDPRTGKAQVTKSLVSSKDDMGMPRGIDPLKEFEVTWKQMFTFKITGEDTVDGEKVYVIEGTFNDGYVDKNPEAQAAKLVMQTVKISLGQKDLFARRITTYNADGNEVIAVEISNLKLNGAVDKKLFTYTPPEGAEIVDKTKPGE